MIYWTDHALQRVCERFASEPWRKVPVREIEENAKCLPVGRVFKVRKGVVVYTCVVEGNGPLVLTVFKANRK